MNKKKIFLPIATGLFVAATLFNVNLLKSNNAGDVSLDAIATMAQAQSEANTNQGTNYPGQYFHKKRILWLQ